MNGDERFDISDPLTGLSFLFLGTPASLDCKKAADADDDAELSINDPVFLLLHLFVGGRAPPPPFAECGDDPTPDPLPCERFAPCPPANGGPLRARVISQVVWPLEDGELSGFTPEEIETLRADGAEITAAEIRSKPLPLSGKYLEVDGVRHMLSREGYITLSDPQVLTAVEVYWQGHR